MTDRIQPTRDYEIACLCGSWKYKDRIDQLREELTLRGMVVLSFDVKRTVEEYVLVPNPLPGEEPEVIVSPRSDEELAILDTVHRRKIELADIVYICVPDNYIGDGTLAEANYAISIGKRVFLIR